MRERAAVREGYAGGVLVGEGRRARARQGILEELRGFAPALRRLALPIAAAGLFAAWLFAVLFSNMPFPYGARLIGNWFDIACAGGFLLAAVGARLCGARFAKRTLALSALFARCFACATMLAGCSCACASLGAALYGARLFVDASWAAAVVVTSGFLAGASVPWFLLALVPSFAACNRKVHLLVSGIIALAALLAFVLVNWLVVPVNQPFAWMLALALAAVLYRRALRSGAPLAKVMNAPGWLACCDAVGSCGDAGSARPRGGAGVVGSRGGDAAPERLVRFFVLLGCFFLSFVIGNFTTIFHQPLFGDLFVHAGFVTGVLLGHVDAAVVLALGLSVALLLLVGVCLASKELRVSLLSAVGVLMIVGASVAVPAYNGQLVVIVLLPFTLVMLALGMAVLFAEIFPAHEKPVRAACAAESEEDPVRCRALIRMERVMVNAGVALLAAAVVSAVHMATNFGVLDVRQMLIFAFMIGVVAADILIVIQLRSTLLHLYFPERVRGLAPMEASANQREDGAADESFLVSRCRTIASDYGLTKREVEVLELLAEGRDGPYIQEKLSISRNTFKSHSLHIYQKLGISSKQKLLDLVRDDPFR